MTNQGKKDKVLTSKLWIWDPFKIRPIRSNLLESKLLKRVFTVLKDCE